MTRPSLVPTHPSAGFGPSDRSSISRSSRSSYSPSTSSPQRVANRYVSTLLLGYDTLAAASSSPSSSVSCEGYLRMKKRSALTWSTRFVILRGRDLYVFYSKQDATHRRNLVDALELEGGKIAAAPSRVDLGLELHTTDKREFHARVFSRAAGSSASNKRAKHDQEATSTEPNQQEEASESGPVQPQDGEEEECNPVVQSAYQCATGICFCAFKEFACTYAARSSSNKQSASALLKTAAKRCMMIQKVSVKKGGDQKWERAIRVSNRRNTSTKWLPN